jgi:hypothetical protein
MEILSVSCMNAERDLERKPCPLRKLDEFAELVRLYAESPAFMLDGSESSAPGGDSREAIERCRHIRRPIVKHDRLSDRQPADTAGRNSAPGSAYVFGDREVHVVARQCVAQQPSSVPYLRESGVDVDVCFASYPSNNLFELQVATDVHEQVRSACGFEQFLPFDAIQLISSTMNEGSGAIEAEASSYLPEIGKIHRCFEGRDGTFSIDARLGRNLLDKDDIEAELTESGHPAHADPGLAAVTVFVGQSSGDEDRRQEASLLSACEWGS